MASIASVAVVGKEPARSGATLSRPRQYTHSSAAGDKLNPDPIGPLVTATGRYNKASQKMVPPEERCPARNDVYSNQGGGDDNNVIAPSPTNNHASAHRGWNIKLLLPVFYVLLVTVTGKEKHWLSSSSNDEHVIRIQRGNRGDRASRMVDIGRTPLGRGGSPKNIPPPVDDVIHAYRTQRGKWGASAQSHSRRFLSFKDKYGSVERDRRVTGGDQRKIALNSAPIWNDKALKSVPSGELGVTKDKTTFAKASMGKITPTTEVTTKGEASRRARAAAPGYFFIIFFGRCPQDYIIMSRHGDKLSPVHKTGTQLLRVAPTSPPIRQSKIMRRISEGGEELRIGICGGE